MAAPFCGHVFLQLKELTGQREKMYSNPSCFILFRVGGGLEKGHQYITGHFRPFLQ